jgi:integrative and conjugative element protein (TIGR02256 family)
VSSGITIVGNEEKIKVCPNIINTMRKYIQKGDLKESGGILIGKENKSNENLIINHITVPMFKDKRKYDRFIRKDEGHIEVFKNLYKASDETLRYIGEWHTHPEAVPSFSSIDLNNWIKICKDSNYDNDYYHVIIGYEAVRIWTMNNKESQIRLISTTFWKDME